MDTHNRGIQHALLGIAILYISISMLSHTSLGWRKNIGETTVPCSAIIYSIM
ncbi:hypothetical protein [Cerasicoccus maritimus]|uniref:hypothetical protein n=1 Tax=Cerasicoccus maritimus TaxID=490089 RepID=UPI002852B2D6|nr:hypothetical protein [Cerasicoccus maritimus]